MYAIGLIHRFHNELVDNSADRAVKYIQKEPEHRKRSA